MESTGGLIEVVRWRTEGTLNDSMVVEETPKDLTQDALTLQVAHGGVTDFFFKSGAARIFKNGIEKSLAEECHVRRFEVCKAYLQCPEFRFCSSPSVHQKWFARKLLNKFSRL